MNFSDTQLKFSGTIDTRNATHTVYNPDTYEVVQTICYPNIDTLYGPYNSIQEAFDSLKASNKEGNNALVQGKTVGVFTNEGIREYWLKDVMPEDGYTIENLVPKASYAHGLYEDYDISKQITCTSYYLDFVSAEEGTVQVKTGDYIGIDKTLYQIINVEEPTALQNLVDSINNHLQEVPNAKLTITEDQHSAIATISGIHDNIIYYCTNTEGDYKGKILLNGAPYGGENKKYQPSSEDTAKIDLQTNTTASQLRGKPLDEVIDILFFPEYNSEAGTLPVLAIENNNQILEVGTSISAATYKITTAAKACKYILKDGKYSTFTYTTTNPTVNTSYINASGDTVEARAIFGNITRTTAPTSYTVTGPDASTLAEGKYLYKSKGTPTNIQPKQIGTSGSKTLQSSSATITGVYKGGKGGVKTNDIFIKSDGTLANTINSTYNNTLSYNVLTDTASTSDHAFNTLGTKTVQLYVPQGMSYNVKFTATMFDAGSSKFIENSTLTNKLNSIIPTTNTMTFKDANNSDYTVTSYSLNSEDITQNGKFIVKVLITKN